MPKSIIYVIRSCEKKKIAYSFYASTFLAGILRWRTFFHQLEIPGCLEIYWTQERHANVLLFKGPVFRVIALVISNDVQWGILLNSQDLIYLVCSNWLYSLKLLFLGLPCGPVVRTSLLQCGGARLWSLVGELRSHIAAKNEMK